MFIVNVPIVIGAIVAGRVARARVARPGSRTRIDWIGAVLSRSSGSCSLVSAIIEAPNTGLDQPAVLGASRSPSSRSPRFVSWERRVEDPMLDVRFFRNPRFTAASATITLVFFALFGFVFLATQYLQFVLGYSPLDAGVRTLPFAAAMIVVAPSRRSSSSASAPSASSSAAC